MLLLLLSACDELRTPCAEVQASEVVIFGQCPDHTAVEISSINVYDGDLNVVWAAGTQERGSLLESVTYGVAPTGWTSTIGPEPLVSGEGYGVDLSYFDAPKASLDFVAP